MSRADAGHTLLYLVYGQNQKYQQELSYSVLSAFREAKEETSDLQVLLFCDAANQRPDLPVTSYVMSEEERRLWTLEGTYNHAIKIFALRKALEIAGGKVCFVDTDTAFKQNPRRLFDRITKTSAIMHASEGVLSDLHSWSSLLGKAAAAGLDDVVSPSARMYNSGLIGVMPTMSEALEEACTLMRRLHEIEPVFNIEQFVLGALLPRDGEMQLAEDLVDHYWGYRRHIYHGQIPSALAALKGQYSAQTAQNLPVITDPQKPLAAKLRARIHAMLNQTDATYRFGYLAYLASGSAGSAEERDVWAHIALDMLERSEAKDLARRSFRRFAPEGLKDSGLNEALQKEWMSFWSAAD
ncbi:hypothetical protein ACOTTU_21885 [Roseobacter sp. EG26]|uniref:hypothetical protein n=1 Tax=Roseobacter sp. EG26 TaxID=3412477 RepID=UPI003CE4886B